MELTGEQKIFRRRLDFYYITLLLYVVTGTVYILVAGSIIGDKFEFVFRDPVVYIIGAFILYAIILLLLNVVRNRRIIITPLQLIFKSRFGERIYFFAHIERILLKKERPRFTNTIFRVVKIRLLNRRRWIRIRVAQYEREWELYHEFKELKHRLKK